MRNVSTPLNQVLAHGFPPFLDAVEEGCLPLPILQINITASASQQLTHFDLPLSARIEERGLAISVECVQVNPFLNQVFYEF